MSDMFIQGTVPARISNMIGGKFSRLTIQSYLGYKLVGKMGLKQHMVLANCDCGNSKPVSARHVLSGDVTSCRCLHRQIAHEVNLKHGQALKTRAYRSWASMMSRCRNPNDKKYHKYGARGIGVCEKWLDFRGFYEDMGDTPDGLTLHRVDNNKGYCFENCVWADNSTQCRQKTTSVFVVLNGERMNATDAERKLGWNKDVICGRLRAGWAMERAVSKPPKKKCSAIVA